MGVLLYSGSIDGLRVKCQETFGLIFFWVVKPFPHNFWIPYPVAPSVLSTNLHEVHGLLDNWLSDGKDSRIWLWAKNGNFFTKSFYNFLNNNGLRCLLRKLLWKVECPLKKKFYWPTSDSMILILYNLAKCGCSRISMTTCVLYHAVVETGDHIILNCPFAYRIWAHYCALLNGPHPPCLQVWISWVHNCIFTPKGLGNLVVYAIYWTI